VCDEVISIEIVGDVVERQELLNGNQTVAFEGASADGAWMLSGTLTWNRGLEAGAEEGDLTLANGPDEVFCSLTTASIQPAEDVGAAYRIAAEYDIDGGAGRFAAASGRLSLHATLEGDAVLARIEVAITGA
jgi:hypothetical protein